uniref:Large ribosomal subunit protein mL59 domain-containing protein n=1 Tax=Hanusia phi TaxID=3032 RepID=A0A7S0EGJ4_9CRYP
MVKASTGMASRRVTWGKSLAEKLAMLPHGAKPTKREDARPGMRHWTKPLFSKRHLKEMKKEAEAQGLAWPMAGEEKAPAAPLESFYEKTIFMSKGSKRERQYDERKKKIQDKMAEMPKLVEEHLAAQKQRRSRTVLEKLLEIPRRFRR